MHGAMHVQSFQNWTYVIELLHKRHKVGCHVLNALSFAIWVLGRPNKLLFGNILVHVVTNLPARSWEWRSEAVRQILFNCRLLYIHHNTDIAGFGISLYL